MGLNNYFWLLIIGLYSCQQHDINTTQLLSKWALHYNDSLYSVNVPSNNVSDLLQHHLIADPFVGTNEDSIQWIAQNDWTYSTSFDVLPSMVHHTNRELIFHGLDTYAKVYLNDSLLLQADNMFRKWNIAVNDIIKEKNNTLKIVFSSVHQHQDLKRQALGYDLPGGDRVHSRKAAFHYGWDWGAKINPSGIWKRVEISAWSKAKIKDFYLEQTDLSDSLAKINAHVQLDIQQEGRYQIQLNNNSYFFNLKKGPQQLSIPITIEKPLLWWPSSHGQPKRYSIDLNLLKDKKLIQQTSQKIGLRTVELITDKTAQGSVFYFKINGKAIFMKGANYIPQDHLQNRVKSQHYHDLLNNVKQANMNMLRVWGGGIYEQDLFYDLCDSLGILVWQDFMFACAMYPSDSVFLQSVHHEAQDNLLRLRHHPSIILWCGNNESSEGWQRWGWQNTFNESQKNAIEKGYDTLFKNILPQLVAQYTNLPYWESSPQLGRGDPQHQFQGDAHYWGVWHDAEPFHVLEKKVPRFMSEFGFQSLPSFLTIKQFANNSNDWNLESKVMQSHQKHPRGNALILQYLSEEYHVPDDFEKFIYASQVLQAQGLRLGLEAHRRNQPHCMGSLYWQLNDCWPVTSWSSIDYYGRWKALHYTVKDVFSPLALSLSQAQNGLLQIDAMSDLANTIEDTLVIFVYDLNGHLITSHKKQVEIKPNSSTNLWTDFSLFKNNQCVQAQLQNSKVKSKTLLTDLPKNCRFKKPNIHLSWNEDTLLLSSDIPAFQVYMHAIEGHFSDNFFTLLPHQQKRITFSGNEQSKNNLVIWTLYDLQDNEK